MRLHTLELQAIGPYPALQRIDFGRLAGSGLFLLEGPTGAGKTTILDAITFALYGGLAGSESAGDRLRSHFAPPDAEPSVTLEFSIGGVRYRVRRSPEYQRPKRRGDGFTVQHAQVHLERLDDGRWASLSSNKAEAGELITEAVGLNRDQFTQVMLLPQGEFATFLRSSDDDRRALLTKLFRTQLYDRITGELERGRQEASRARQESQARIDTCAAAAAEAAGLDAEARGELLAASRNDRATRLKEVAAELARTIEVTRDGLEIAATSLAAAQQADAAARRQAELMTRLTGALDRLAAHEATRPGHEELTGRLGAARQAEPVRPLLTALDEAEQLSQAARTALAEVVAVLDAELDEWPGGPAGAELRAWLADLLAASGVAGAADLAVGRGAAGGGAETDSGSAAGDDAAADDAAGSWPDSAAATARAAAAAARAEDDDRQATALEHLVAAEAARPDAVAELTALRAAAEAAAGRVTTLERSKEDLPARITALQERLDGARVIAAGLAQAREQQAAAEAQLAAAVRAEELRDQLTDLEAARQAAIDAHQEAVDAHQRAMEERLENMAAELAERLADDGPCPVCGSTDHPGPAMHQADAVSADDVAAAASRRDAAAQQRDQAQQARDELAAEAGEASAAAGGATSGQLEAAVAELADRVQLAEQAAAEAEQLGPEADDLRAEQEKLAEELVAAAGDVAGAEQKAADAAARLDRLDAELAAAAGDSPSVTARQQRLRELALAGRTLAQALGALAEAGAAEQAARLRAESELAAGGLTSLAAARAAVLSPAELARLAGQAEEWTSALAGLTAAVRADDLAGLDPGQAAAVAAAAQAAAADLTGAQDAERLARDSCQALTARDERLGQRMAELALAEEAADRTEEETGPVIRLAALARGMDGHRRIALTTYVLRRWFEQVVQAANVRLAAMSAGRYELARTEEGESRRQRTGLTLAVIDRYTGEERSPRSLSGGETFYTSLALALGLADVVRAEAGGVELDTLFIDEGFGSLDAHTLDQVMAVIDELRDRGRAVGIVSHVADLKDRVYERLEVRRLPDGSSAATVVA